MNEKYEIICDECGTAFESDDEAATVCSECWEKLIDFDGEGAGEQS